MSLYETLILLTSMDVKVISSEDDRIKLVSNCEILPEAVESAFAIKGTLIETFHRSEDLPPCPVCKGKLLAVPTFDGFENFECLNCDRCFGCRSRTQLSLLPPESRRR